MSYRYSAHSCQLADRTKSGKAIPQWPQPGGPGSVEFELPGDKAVVHRDGNRLVIEPVRKRGLIAPLKSMKPIEERFPEIDDP